MFAERSVDLNKIHILDRFIILIKPHLSSIHSSKVDLKQIEGVVDLSDWLSVSLQIRHSIERAIECARCACID